jgi:tRNA (cmo5U34)-methyltransferase
MNVREAFDRSAQIYDRGRRQLVPCFDDFYATAIDRIPFPAELRIDVLDLGAGTGLLSLFVSQSFPQARLTLLDVSDEMLSRARQRFAGDEARVAFVLRDFSQPLPGSYDLVISALAIHHLLDDDKRALYARIFGALRPAGVFINADQVMGPSAALERSYHEAWLRQVRALGVGETDLAAALERMKEDRMAPLEPQLAWLRQAGFSDVDCWYKHYRFAVFSGTKPA